MGSAAENLHDPPTLKTSDPISKLDMRIQYKVHWSCVLIGILKLLISKVTIKVHFHHTPECITDFISTFKIHLLLARY